MTENQNERWIEGSNDRQVQYYHIKGKTVQVDNSLVEQLQSEAVEKYKNELNFTKETMEFIKLVQIDERVMQKFVDHIAEEARADERKKILNLFDKVCREHAKKGFELELDPVKLGTFTGTLYKKLESELEQPVQNQNVTVEEKNDD